MFEEMALAGLSDPEFHQSDSGFKVTLRLRAQTARDTPSSKWDNAVIRFIMRDMNETGRASVSRTVMKTGFSAPTVRRHFQRLSDAGIIERVARSSTDPHAYWILRKVDVEK
jgi:predicted HTH transcriptional regulator